jgi:hypothetical protein
VPAVEEHPEAQAAIVLDPEVRVVPATVTVAPDVPFVARDMVCDPLVTAPVERVPKATVLDPRLKVRVWGTVADTATWLLERIGTVTDPESDIVPPIVIL